MNREVPPAQELGLLLCSTAARRHARRVRIRELTRTVPTSEVLRFLVPQRLGLLAVSRLQTVEDVEIGKRHLAEAERAHSVNTLRAMLLEESTARALRALDAGGIRAMPVKGPRLGLELYGDPALRPSGDVDVLVEPARLHDAVRVLARGIGFHPVGSIRPRSRRPDLHYVMIDPAGVLPPVELHWRIHWYESKFADELLASATGPERRPDVAHDLAALLVFYARDGFAGLRLATDLAGWWDRFGPELQMGELDRILTRHPALRAPVTAAALMAARVVGFPASRVLALNKTDVPQPRRMGMALRLGNWSMRGSPEHRSTAVVLVDGMLTPKGNELAFWRRALDPSHNRGLLLGRSRTARLIGTATHPLKVLVRGLGVSLWVRFKPLAPLPR